MQEHNKLQTLWRSIKNAEEELEEAIEKSAGKQVWKLERSDETELRELVILKKKSATLPK